MKTLLLMKNLKVVAVQITLQQLEQMIEYGTHFKNYVKARQMSFYDILQMSLFRRCAKRGWDQIIK